MGNALRGSGGPISFAVCGPFCAPQACARYRHARSCIFTFDHPRSCDATSSAKLPDSAEDGGDDSSCVSGAHPRTNHGAGCRYPSATEEIMEVERSALQNRCVFRGCAGVDVERYAFHPARILRAQAIHSQGSSSVCLSRSTPRLISTFSQSRDVVSNFVHTAARATPLTRRGAAARSTPLCPSDVASLSWTDRRHHVPALAVTNSGRNVGFDMHISFPPILSHGRGMLGDVWTIVHSSRHLSPRASSLYFMPLSSCHPGP